MRNRLTTPLLILIISTFVTSTVQADHVLWKSGVNLYIKLVKQDKSRRADTPPNQHPVALNAEQITQALQSLQVYYGSGFFADDKPGALLSIQQCRLLGQYLSAGLRTARANQDIVFVLARLERKYLLVRNTKFTGGRAFYLDGRLQLIIGDYDSQGDRFKERAQQSAGVTDVKQYFKVGRRARKSDFKGEIIASDGVSVHQEGGSKERNDWITIDVPVAAAAYLAEQASEIAEDPAQALVQAEAARLARERRALRLEMARMRKEMQQAGGGQQPASVEQRLLTLKALLDKQLISTEEYQRRRREILSDI